MSWAPHTHSAVTMHLAAIFTQSGTQRTSTHSYLHLSRSDGSGPVLATAGGSHPLVCEPPSQKTAQADTKAGAYPNDRRVNIFRFWGLPCWTEAAHPKQVSQTGNWPAQVCKGFYYLARMGAEPSSTQDCWTCIAWSPSTARPHKSTLNRSTAICMGV